MTGPSIEVALPVRARLGECPLWEPDTDRLWWIDIDDRAVHRCDPATGDDEVVRIDGRPGSIARTATPGRLLAAVEHAVVDLAWPSGQLRHRVALEPDGRASRLNDGRCDRQGRFWVGAMQDPVESGTFVGGLYRVDGASGGDSGGNGGPEVYVERATGVGVSNGLAFSPDGRTMYWADSMRAAVWAYDYDPDSGQPSGERHFASFDGSGFDGSGAPGFPDGACVDADGCYWVACVMGSALARFTPAGDLDRVIDLPVRRPTMPAFGGPDLGTLFVTSLGGDGAAASTDPDDPLAGALLALDVGVRGLADPVAT